MVTNRISVSRQFVCSRNTSIAIEEVKRGLVPYTTTEIQEKSENDASLL